MVVIYTLPPSAKSAKLESPVDHFQTLHTSTFLDALCLDVAEKFRHIAWVQSVPPHISCVIL